MIIVPAVSDPIRTARQAAERARCLAYGLAGRAVSLCYGTQSNRVGELMGDEIDRRSFGRTRLECLFQ